MGNSYAVNPFFDSRIPLTSDPEAFRRFVLAPENAAFWRKKVESWRRQGIRITPEEYVSRLIAQDFRCGICHLEYTVFHKMLAVDHRHTRDDPVILGLLCARDNYERGRREMMIYCGARIRWTLEQAIYLRKSGEKWEGVGNSDPSA
jgi:hypothetical protein